MTRTAMPAGSPRTPVLQIAPLPSPQLNDALASEFDVTLLSAQPDPARFLAQHGGRFAYVVTSAAIGLKAEVVRALPRLAGVSSFGVGFDALDQPSLQERGARVGYTPGVLDECVADLAFALLMDAARGLSAADRFVRAGLWRAGRFGIQHKVSGKRLGILGMGRIGAQVAQRAQGFGMAVGYHNRRPAAQSPHTYCDSPLALAQWCDFLVVTAAGGADTRHLVDARVLDALGPQGFLVNVARGSVVDEAALVEALRGGRIAGAGLDVFEHEPHPHPDLLALDNVVLAPHMASGTHETRRAMAELTLANLRALAATGRPVAEVPWSAAR
jgi:lactate dehydrogenase-like 2-hydroxyacid dehydrogenase